MKDSFRQGLSAPGMYSLIQRQSQKIPDKRRDSSHTIPQSDAIMSVCAMFSLKYPSMLQFCKDTNNQASEKNLKDLFHVGRTPSDTSMREILDSIPTVEFKKFFSSIFSLAQRGKVLERYTYLEGKYLLSVDGTGFFSSSKVHCENCCVKSHRDGSKTYYHQLLSGVLVHPSHKEVIPIAPEPISKQDGVRKNDCERAASERLLRHFRQEHPHLKVIVVEDGLASNAPHINLLKELDLSYILGCKPGDHKALFQFVEGCEKLGEVHLVTIQEGEVEHRFKFINQIPLNEANPDCLVNFLQYEEVRKDGKVQRFSWVTDIEITKNNIMKIMRGARARWKIENETFNTLKNLGYNFEHNFGHGYQNLSNNLALLMMLVFLVDQLQRLACPLFQAALVKMERLSYLWRKMRRYFDVFHLKNWETFFKIIIHDFSGVPPPI